MPKIVDFTTMRLHKRTRGGEILIQMRENGERAKGGESARRELQPATLEDLGIEKTDASRWQSATDLLGRLAFLRRDVEMAHTEVTDELFRAEVRRALGLAPVAECKED